MSDQTDLCLQCGAPWSAHGFGAPCRIFLRRARPRVWQYPLDEAEIQLATLRSGLQQVITEMRDDRLTWGIHGKTLLIRQFEVLKLADRLELLAGLSEARGNAEHNGQVEP